MCHWRIGQEQKRGQKEQAGNVARCEGKGGEGQCGERRQKLHQQRRKKLEERTNRDLKKLIKKGESERGITGVVEKRRRRHSTLRGERRGEKNNQY